MTEDDEFSSISRHEVGFPDGSHDSDKQELRISNFLLWQLAYSEFYLLKNIGGLWDFSLETAILDYASRENGALEADSR